LICSTVNVIFLTCVLFACPQVLSTIPGLLDATGSRFLRLTLSQGPTFRLFMAEFGSLTFSLSTISDFVLDVRLVRHRKVLFVLYHFLVEYLQL
jgi:hypothetical protein